VILFLVSDQTLLFIKSYMYMPDVMSNGHYLVLFNIVQRISCTMFLRPKSNCDLKLCLLTVYVSVKIMI
jgi:hypothetical protein